MALFGYYHLCYNYTDAARKSAYRMHRGSTSHCQYCSLNSYYGRRVDYYDIDGRHERTLVYSPLRTIFVALFSQAGVAFY